MAATSSPDGEAGEREGEVEVVLEGVIETQADVYAESNEVCTNPGGHDWVADEQMNQVSGYAPDLGLPMQTTLSTSRGEERQRCVYCGRLRWAGLGDEPARQAR